MQINLTFRYYFLLLLQDMLQHEAHRHPYLERIGVVYMMKLRYGDRFGNEAGTSWRLLFVYALFPWLRKYRIRGEEAGEKNESVKQNDSSRTGSMHVASGKGRENRQAMEEEIKRLKSEVGETEALKKELIRMKSEILRLSKCLDEAKTEGNF